MYELGRYLKCQNALPGAARPCWNHVQVPVDLTRQKVVGWLLAEPANTSWARETLVNWVWIESERLQRGSRSDSCRLERRSAELQAAASNLAKAIAKGGELDALVQELTAIQVQIGELRAQKEKQADADGQDTCRLTRAQVGLQLEQFTFIRSRGLEYKGERSKEGTAHALFIDGSARADRAGL